MHVTITLKNDKQVQLDLEPLQSFLNSKLEISPQQSGEDLLLLTNRILSEMAITDPQKADDVARCLHALLGSVTA